MGRALYNNGGFPYKNARFGESYSPDGTAAADREFPIRRCGTDADEGHPAASRSARAVGKSRSPAIFCACSSAAAKPRAEIGNPESGRSPGLPDDKLSDRGLGTLLRTDPVFLGLQKTRLLDPLLSMPGTNDHPGDYRHSGCTACHVIYANDRSPVHSGPYAQYGNRGPQRADGSHDSEE